MVAAAAVVVVVEALPITGATAGTRVDVVVAGVFAGVVMNVSVVAIIGAVGMLAAVDIIVVTAVVISLKFVVPVPWDVGVVCGVALDALTVVCGVALDALTDAWADVVIGVAPGTAADMLDMVSM